MLGLCHHVSATALVDLIVCNQPSFAKEKERGPCTEDAMVVFDASGSMSGNGWGYGSETGRGAASTRCAPHLPRSCPTSRAFAGWVSLLTVQVFGTSAIFISTLHRRQMRPGK